MKKLLLILLVLISFSGYGQNECLEEGYKLTEHGECLFMYGLKRMQDSIESYFNQLIVEYQYETSKDVENKPFYYGEEIKLSFSGFAEWLLKKDSIRVAYQKAYDMKLKKLDSLINEHDRQIEILKEEKNKIL